MKTEFRKFSCLKSLSRDAAFYVRKIINEKIEEKGCCSIVLSGGKTPVFLYELFADPRFASKIPWERIHFFWGDERCVPSEDAQSNFNMASTAFLSKIEIPRSNIYPVRADTDTPDSAAEAYEKEIKKFFISFKHGSKRVLPGFDLMLLGMGKDGHTASLFPGSDVLDETSRWVLPVKAPEAYQTRMRITLTLPVINISQHVLFLVSGREKEAVVKEIKDNRKKAAELYPAARVRAQEKLIWFVDF